MSGEHGLPLCVDEDRDERWRGDPNDYATDERPSAAELAREYDDEEDA